MLLLHKYEREEEEEVAGGDLNQDESQLHVSQRKRCRERRRDLVHSDRTKGHCCDLLFRLDGKLLISLPLHNNIQKVQDNSIWMCVMG